MSNKSTQRMTVIIFFCLVLAVAGTIVGLKKLSAQGMPGMPTGAGSPMAMPQGGGMMSTMPGMPGMAGGGMMGGSSQSSGGAVVTKPTEPAISFTAVASGVQTKNIKNWDGTITPMLRFKYKLGGNRIITVHLPKALIKEKRTRNGWEALFQSYSMDMEAKIDAAIRDNPPASSGSTGNTGMTGMTMPGMPTMPGGAGMMPTMPGMPGGAGSPMAMPGGVGALPGMPPVR